MSQTFTLSGRRSIISKDYFPPIQLERGVRYSLGLIGFFSSNNIPNVDTGRNKFFYTDDKGVKKEFTLPTGVYEISHIEKVLQKEIGEKNISLTIDEVSQKCKLTCSHDIDFTQDGSINKILGFRSDIYGKKKLHTSNQTVEINKVITLRVESNITNGSYYNQEPNHSIHEFAVNVDAGYAIIEVPPRVIYYEVNSRTINNITLSIIDQEGDLVNFQNELIIIRLELTKNGFDF